MKILFGRHGLFHSLERDYHSFILEVRDPLERFQRRKELIAEVYDYFLTKEPGSNISSVVSDTIKKNLKVSPETWNPELSAAGFACLEEYAWHLYDDPWKPELRYIKVYTGVLQVHVKPYIPNIESILAHLGYKMTPKGFKLKSNVLEDKDALIKGAVHCLIGHIECTILAELLGKVKIYGLNCNHVYECRMNFKGSVQDCVRWMKAKHNKHDKPLPIETTDHITDSAVKTTGIGARPKETLTRQHHKNASNGRTSSRMVTARSTSREEFQCPLISEVDLYGADIKENQPDEDYYRPGTFEDHLQESLSILSSGKSTQKSESPINMDGWEMLNIGNHVSPKNHIRSDPIPIANKQDDAGFLKLLYKKGKQAEAYSSVSCQSQLDIPGKKVSSTSYGIAYPPLLLPSSVLTDGPVDVQKTVINVTSSDDRDRSSSVLYRGDVAPQPVNSSVKSLKRTSPQSHNGEGIGSNVSRQEVQLPVDTYEVFLQSSQRDSIYDNVPPSHDRLRSYSQDPYRASSDIIKSDDLYTSANRTNSHHSMPNISDDSSKLVPASIRKGLTEMTDFATEENDPASTRPMNQLMMESGYSSVITQSAPVSVCCHCTVFIPLGSNVCDLCGKTQESDHCDKILPSAAGGVQCPKCTLVNKASARKCEACKTSLRGRFNSTRV